MSYEDTQSTHDQLKLQNKRTTYCESKMETSQKNNTNTRKDTHTHTHTHTHAYTHKGTYKHVQNSYGASTNQI